MLGGAAHPKAGGFKIVQCAGDVGDLGDGKVHDRTGRGLIGGNRHLGGALVGDHHARSTHNLCGANDGAEVARIRHVVQDQHQRGALARMLDDIGKVRVRKAAHLQRDALVSTVA